MDTEICNGFSTNLTATGGVSYEWSNSAMTASTTVDPSVQTKYYVTVTDANLCENTDSIIVDVNLSPIISITPTDEICSDASDGTATANIDTPSLPTYSYLWSTTETTPTISGLTAGNYSLTVTDGKGCRDTVMTTIAQPDTLLPNLIFNQDTCQMLLGSSIATPTGGTSGYTYNWSAGLTDSIQTGLGVGMNVVTITDTNGCMTIDSILVMEIDTCVKDLALKKVLLTSGDVFPGEFATFKITVYNQGTIDATDIVVKDYFPSDLILQPDANWYLESPGVVVDSIASILAKDSFEVNITFQIDPNFANSNRMIVNNAEVTEAYADGEVDEDGLLSIQNDGSSNELSTDNDVNDSSPWTVGTADNPTDEDDYDPATLNAACREVCLPVTIKVNPRD